MGTPVEGDFDSFAPSAPKSDISLSRIRIRVPLTDRGLLELPEFISSVDRDAQIITRKGDPPQAGADGYVGGEHQFDLDARIHVDEDPAQ